MAAPLRSQICNDFAGGPFVGPGAELGNLAAGPNCPPTPSGFYCYPAKAVSTTTSTPGCDPTAASCPTVRATVELELQGTSQNRTIAPAKWTTADWKLGAVGVGSCGKGTADITQDKFLTWIDIGGFSCSEGSPPPANAGVYTLVVDTCNLTGCSMSRSFTVDLQAPAIHAELCPPPPPPPPTWDCGTNSCSAACFGPGGGIGGGGNGGSSAGGGPPSLGPEGDGPGAHLRYRGGGTGHPDHPMPASWNATLGRFWSHDYAEAIVEDPDATHVWLLTSSATFREFTDAGGDGDYETAVPSDEYRQLTKTAGGWELRDLDGAVQFFDVGGRWTQTAPASTVYASTTDP